MKPFITLSSNVIPLLRDNVDTDVIIPSREMLSTGRSGLANGLFGPWRYLERRLPNPDFVLNQPEYAGAQILLAGKNFGCGSSREHAVWALMDYGIRAVIAESFAPIFQNNCLRNGLLPIILPPHEYDALLGTSVLIDLAAQSISIPGHCQRFDIDPEAKLMLLGGLDAIDVTLKHTDAIAAFHAADRTARPWVYL